MEWFGYNTLDLKNLKSCLKESRKINKMYEFQVTRIASKMQTRLRCNNDDLKKNLFGKSRSTTSMRRLMFIVLLIVLCMMIAVVETIPIELWCGGCTFKGVNVMMGH